MTILSLATSSLGYTNSVLLLAEPLNSDDVLVLFDFSDDTMVCSLLLTGFYEPKSERGEDSY